MVHRSTDARLKYLDEAARLLVATSPATAAFLESECNWIALQNDIALPESRRKEVCGACGNLFISRSSMEVVKQEQRPSTRKRRADQSYTSIKAPEDIVYQCKRCYSETRLSDPKSAKKGKEIKAPMSIPASKSADTSGRGTSDFNMREISHPTAGAESPTTVSTAKTPAATSINVTSSTGDNMNSKKRAKARKQGGLQAMLARSKTESSVSKGFGLDFMDFMKED